MVHMMIVGGTSINWSCLSTIFVQGKNIPVHCVGGNNLGCSNYSSVHTLMTNRGSRGDCGLFLAQRLSHILHLKSIPIKLETHLINTRDE